MRRRLAAPVFVLVVLLGVPGFQKVLLLFARQGEVVRQSAVRDELIDEKLNTLGAQIERVKA